MPVTKREVTQPIINAQSTEEADKLVAEWLDSYKQYLKLNFGLYTFQRRYERDPVKPNPKNEPGTILSSLLQLEANAENGHVASQAALARYYRKYSDPDIQKKAFHFAEMAAKNGSIRSKFFLATYLTEGKKGTNIDLPRAAALLDEIIKAGKEFKQRTLKVYIIRHPEVKPHMSNNISAVAQSEDEASAAAKSFTAMVTMRQGPDFVKFIKVDAMDKAILSEQVIVNAESGHLPSQLALKEHYASCFFNNEKTKENLLHFTELAAAKGDLNSKFESACQYTEGYINLTGETVSRDLTKAANLFIELRKVREGIEQEKVEQYLSKHAELDEFMREDLKIDLMLVCKPTLN